jgi:hypothetical protein
MACPNSHEHALVDDGLDRRNGCIDTRLEGWTDQGDDRLTSFSRCGDGYECTLPLMRLNQDDDAIGPHVLPGSLEGMDHALGCDSSKRPAEEHHLEWVAIKAKPFG